jgi:hypothetical protein
MRLSKPSSFTLDRQNRRSAVEALLSVNNIRRTALDPYRVSAGYACHNSRGHNYRYNFYLVGQRKGIVRHMVGIGLTLLQLIGHGLSAKISEKFISRIFDVAGRIDYPASQSASLARLMNREDWPLFSGLEFDLHRAILVASSDNRGTTVPKVGKEFPSCCS